MKPPDNNCNCNSQNLKNSTRVCVSGVGVICAAGNNANEVMQNMLDGNRTPSIHPTLFNSPLNKPVFECDSSVLNHDFLPENRTLALLIKAVEEALNDAGITPEILKKRKVGICIGTTVACTLNDLKFYSELRNNSVSNTSALYRYLCSDLSLVTADLLGLENVVTLDVANACSSGTNAVSVGYSWILSGLCDIVIAGGADELNEVPYCGFNSLQVMSEKFCLPFDERRQGLNLGEGAGILILESESSISKQNICDSVYIAASAEGSDAYHLTGPHPQGVGLKNAILKLFDERDSDKNNIDYINAHGTATINNDRIESLVFKDIFGDNIPYSSTKYFTGHTLAAAGAIEAVVCVLGMRTGSFPGLPEVDTAEDVAVAPSEKNIKYNGGCVISTSMAFGGSCAALLFSPMQKMKKIKSPEVLLPVSFNVKENALKTLNKIAGEISSEFIPGIKCSAVGVVSPLGIGFEPFEMMMKNNIENSDNIHCGSIKGKTISKQIFNDTKFKKMRRRADKLSLASFAAASNALENYGKKLHSEKTALIFLTSFGAYVTTFRFLDGLIDFGFDAPSPTQFSNSVHNASAFYISKELDIKGPTLSLNGFNNLFLNGLRLASTYLNYKNYDNVLLVAGDEICPEFLRIIDLLNDDFSELKIDIPKVWIEASSAFILEKGHGVTLPDLNYITCFETNCGYSMIREALPFAASYFELDS
jgi:3-oxoacyl-(acyl-carrier-protein) synthase